VLVDLDVVIEPDPALLPFGKDVGFGRQRLRAGRSSCSNSMRRQAPRCRDTRSLICTTSSAMAAFKAEIAKNCRLRSLATMKRVAI